MYKDNIFMFMHLILDKSYIIQRIYNRNHSTFNLFYDPDNIFLELINISLSIYLDQISKFKIYSNDIL